jgi:DNA mismatch repair ATPase MutS
MTNLEVLRSSAGEHEGSLLEVLDTCMTQGGHRLLRGWLCHPLCDLTQIRRRQDAVQSILSDADLMQCLRDGMQGLPDLDRAMGRVRTAMAEPSAALPHKIQHRAQQRRLGAIRTAVAAATQALEFLRGIVDVLANEVDRMSLLSELCAALPGESDPACLLLSSLEAAVESTGSAPKKGKAAEPVWQLNTDLFNDYEGADDEEKQLRTEICLVTEIMGTLIEQAQVCAWLVQLSLYM